MHKETILREVLTNKVRNMHKLTMDNFQMKSASIFRTIFGKVFVHQTLFVFGALLTKLSFKATSKVEIDVRLAQNDDKPLLRLAKRSRFGVARARKMLKAGHLCFLAEKNGDVVSFTWFSFDDVYIHELERIMRINSDSVYAYGSYVVPEYRGLRIFPETFVEGLDYLFQNGIIQIYSLINPRNIPSQRAVKKIGFRKIGEITLVKMFNSRRYKYKGETSKDCARLKEMFSI